MIDSIYQETRDSMGKAVEALKNELSRLRTGRASLTILDGIKVDYYGTMTPIKQVANVVVEDSRTLLVTPWEKQMVAAVDKAIMTADLGLNPATQGAAIRVPMPALTEERRRDLVKIVKHEAENSRVAVRNIRRDANSDFKDLLKDKEISEDEERKAEDNIQKLTNKYVANIDEIVAAKENEMMEM